MYNREIIIDKNMIHVIKKEIETSLSLEDFAKRIIKRNFLFSTPQLPVNCVKYEKRAAVDRYFCHIPEDNYTFKFDGNPYVVRIPHMLFVFTFNKDDTSLNDKIITLWNDEKILDLRSNSFFVPLLHNIYNDGSVCAGVDTRGKNQCDYVNNYLINFFSTNFNNDLDNGKRMIYHVSADQQKYIEHIEDNHELIKLWWHRLSEKTVGDRIEYSLSKPFIDVKKGDLPKWIKY